jgi:hypothetical protein
MFLNYSGDYRLMSETGKLSEYLTYSIPKDVEEEWRQIIYNNRKIELAGFNTKIELISYINNSIKEGIALQDTFYELKDYINKNSIDDFSLILILEAIKKIVKFSNDIRLITEVKAFIKEKYLCLKNENISVDNEFLSSNQFKNYDFSESNIVERVNKLIEI